MQLQHIWQDVVLSFSPSTIVNHLIVSGDLTLAAIASVLIIAYTPFYMKWYEKSRYFILPNVLLRLKQAIACLLVCNELATLFSSVAFESPHTLYSLCFLIWAPCASVCLCIVIDIEHRHTMQSSAPVALWLAFAVLCDLVRSRAYYVAYGHDLITSLAMVSMALKGGLLLLNELSKSSSFIPGLDLDSRRNTTYVGFYTRLLLRLIPSSVAFGFANRLSLHDLVDLKPEYSSERLVDHFNAISTEGIKDSDHYLFWVLFRLFRRSLLIMGIPRLTSGLLSISQAVFISYFLLFLRKKALSAYHGQLFIALAFVLHTSMTISHASYKHLQRRSATMIRGTLTSAIYAKALKLPYPEAQKSLALTAVEQNVEVALTVPEKVHELWVSIVEVALCMFLLQRQMGSLTFTVLIPLSVPPLGLKYIDKHMSVAQNSWITAIHERISKTMSLLSQTKPIRMLALENLVSDAILQYYEREMKSYVGFRHWSMLRAAIAGGLEVVPIPIILGASIYTISPTRVGPEDGISILAIATLFIKALQNVLRASTKLQPAIMCVTRLQEFLLLDQASDSRIFASQTNDESLDAMPTKRGSEDTKRPTGGTFAESNTNTASDPSESQSARSITIGDDQRQSINLESATPTLQEATEGTSSDCVIRLDQISIAAQHKGKTTLHGIDVSIYRKQLVAIVGPTGSGKSTLLRFLIGEAVRVSGTCSIEPAQMAYCDQTPWLRQASIRSNIVNHLSFDRDWYNMVLHASMLEQDLDQLTAGDETKVATNGTNLSGGQRQRVALARALYSRAPYLLLDNIFAPLDCNTAEAIFQRLFHEDGILKDSSTTVVLITHYAPFIKAASQAIFINPDGSVWLHQDLESSEFQHDLSLLDDNTATSLDDTLEESSELSTAATAVLSANEYEQASIRPTGDAWLYWHYFRTFEPLEFALWLVCVFIATFGESSSELYMRLWLEIDPDNNMFLLGFVALCLATCIFTMIDIHIFFSWLVPSSALDLHEALIITIKKARLEYLTRSGNGLILSHLIQDMSAVSHSLPTFLIRFCAGTFGALARLAVVFTATRQSLILLPFVLAGIYVIQLCYLRTSRQIRYLDLEHRTPLLTQLIETSSGLRHIRAFGWQKQTLRSSLALLDVSQKLFYHMITIETWLTTVLDLTRTTLVMLIVTGAVCWKDTISTIHVGLPLVALISMGGSLHTLVEAWTLFDTALGSFARVRQFILTTPTERDPPKKLLAELPPRWPQVGHIELKGVTARYNGERHAIADISTIITEGQRLGIAGRTGSGKSSLLLTLLNFLDYEGEITIDGIDISKVPRQVLRTRITTISQEMVVLDGTVRHNLCPWKAGDLGIQGQVPDFNMILFLQCLDIWTPIENKGGLDAILSEVGLSEGELQLFSIARGMAHNLATSSRIVIMDEPTGNLDPAAARKALLTLKDALYDHTILVVTHSSDVLKGVDASITMSNGKIKKKKTKKKRQQAEASTSAATQAAFTTPPSIVPYYQQMMEHMEDPSKPPPPPPRRTAVARLRRRFKRTYGWDPPLDRRYR